MYKFVASFLVLLLSILPCTAQQQAPANTLKIPAGTKISLVLTHQISSSETHVGDQVQAQVLAPVLAGTQVAIPAGTYLQANVSKIAQQKDRVQLTLQSVSLAFANGYVANISGPMDLRSDQGWLQPAPNSSRGAALIPLLLAPGIGAGIGAAAGKNAVITPGSISGGQLTPGTMQPSTRGRDAAIGFGVGAGILAVGLVIYALSRNHGAPDFFFAAGAPMQAAFETPVIIDADQVAAVGDQQAPVPIQPIAQRPTPQPTAFPDSTPSGICFGPETPATPPTVIPGTPAIGDSPGTPDIVIPGTPAMPGSMIPCS